MEWPDWKNLLKITFYFVHVCADTHTVKYQIASNSFCEVPQDKQTFLIGFNLINKRCLAIRGVHDLEWHMITTEPMVLLSLSLTAGLWVVISHARMLGLRPQHLAEISDFSGRWKVPTTGTSVFLSLQSTYRQSFAFPDKTKARNKLCFIPGRWKGFLLQVA